ncbi:Tetracycline resistance protein, class C [Pseudovibrio axinellae]|uniref:Tetracycline resistance protein, class C n=1 Tax=Pseudovibrio axinellae TaxID=989403 RepID=A0A165WYR4_9HYPH|nr:MFS transporter [Pseudovibrio axinellae]KZL17046.1 Tetracycline resistance protein, class C [Pseudovibrio axinellae]SEQ17514.1 Predicted arabinose efflux permease, MFS family [Pseudovibrio axinellae]
MGWSRIALLLLVLVDVMGQGLIFPIVNSLVMVPGSTFVPRGDSLAIREIDFSILTGAFYISWFFGGAYISKLSDYIGRKKAILICLFGALFGYALTIAALVWSNLTLLVLARVITGFAAGNQPIAQAALVDLSRTSEEKNRNMGYVTAAIAIGLIVGPLLAGVLSDTSILGSYASLELPFYAALVLILINIALIVVFFHETNQTCRKIDFGLSEVFLVLWRAHARPTILKLCAVFLFVEIGLSAFYIYLNNYMVLRFGFNTLQNSILMIIFGLVLAFVSALLVGPISKRYSKVAIIVVSVSVMAVGLLAFTLNDVAWLSYLLTIPIVAAFALALPLMFSLFSAAADESEQGWVMGVTISSSTGGQFLLAIAGASLMTANIHGVFLAGIACFVIALGLIFVLWRQADIRALDHG